MVRLTAFPGFAFRWAVIAGFLLGGPAMGADTLTPLTLDKVIAICERDNEACDAIVRATLYQMSLRFLNAPTPYAPIICIYDDDIESGRVKNLILGVGKHLTNNTSRSLYAFLFLNGRNRFPCK